MNLLVVDDLKDARDTLAILLRGNGHDVCTANTCEGALNAAITQQPEVILLDVMLPSAAESKKLTESLPLGSRVVMTTALDSDEPLTWPNVIGILRKPFGIEQVEKMLATIQRTTIQRTSIRGANAS